MSISMSFVFTIGIFYVVHEDKGNTTSGVANTTIRTTTGVPYTEIMLRNIFLTTHNNYRASIARGQTERNGRSGEIAPPASLMYAMRYSLAAESLAWQHVNRCDKRLSSPSEIPGYRENINVYNRRDVNKEAAALWAMNEWWSELGRYGIPSNMIYSMELHNRLIGPVRSFTKMAWWNNTELGCAVKNCSTFFFTSCMYAPGGNEVGRRIYNIGAVCSSCPSECRYGLCPLP